MSFALFFLIDVEAAMVCASEDREWKYWYEMLWGGAGRLKFYITDMDTAAILFQATFLAEHSLLEEICELCSCW
jgi:hypothetical protein